jgi:hypothetical protein
MRDAGLLALAAAACYVGFACLALSQDRHWQSVMAGLKPKRWLVIRLRTAGGFALAASLALTLLRDGPSFGSLLWVLLLAVDATVVAFTLTWRAGWLRPVGQAACIGARIGERDDGMHSSAKESQGLERDNLKKMDVCRSKV